MNRARRERLREAWLEIESGARVVHIEKERERASLGPHYRAAADHLDQADLFLTMAKQRIRMAIRQGRTKETPKNGT